MLASVSVDVAGELDVAACVFASRARRGALLRLGAARPRRLRARGARRRRGRWRASPAPNRFAAAAAACAEVVRDAVDRPGPRPASGLGAGLGRRLRVRARAEASTRSGRRCRPRCWCCPELSLARQRRARSRHRERRLPRGRRPGRRWPARRCARLEALGPGSIPLADPDPRDGFEIESVLPPRELRRRRWRGARPMIRRGDAREGRAGARGAGARPAPFRPATVFDGLRSAFPSCFCFCVGTPEAAFVGASPELLVRREGARRQHASRSPARPRRSADPAVDDHLGQRLLHERQGPRASTRSSASRIERSLAPLSVWVAAAAEPALIKVANIQHLATPGARAAGASRAAPSSWPGCFTRRPAVGGEPLGGGARGDGARADGPRLVRGAGRLDGRRRGRRVLRGAALRAARRAAPPTAMPASAWSPTPTPRRSWPRPRSSCRPLLPALTGS